MKEHSHEQTEKVQGTPANVIQLFKRVDGKDKEFWPIVARVGENKIVVGEIRATKEQRRDKGGRLKKSVTRYVGHYKPEALTEALHAAGIKGKISIPKTLGEERRNPLNIPLWYEMIDALKDFTTSKEMDVVVERSRKFS